MQKHAKMPALNDESHNFTLNIRFGQQPISIDEVEKVRAWIDDDDSITRANSSIEEMHTEAQHLHCCIQKVCDAGYNTCNLVTSLRKVIPRPKVQCTMILADGKISYRRGYRVNKVNRKEEAHTWGYCLKDVKLSLPRQLNDKREQVWCKNIDQDELESMKLAWLESDKKAAKDERARSVRWIFTKKRWDTQLRAYAKAKQMKFPCKCFHKDRKRKYMEIAKNNRPKDPPVCECDHNRIIFEKMLKDPQCELQMLSDAKRYRVNNARLGGIFDGVLESIYEPPQFGVDQRFATTPFRW